MLPNGRTFYKMSGSGNDFIMVDAMDEAPGALEQAGVVRDLCARASGVGADGVVFLKPSDAASFRITYLNSDGSRANLCGNACLCAARLAIDLQIVLTPDFQVETDAGVLTARVYGSEPELDFQPVADVRPQLPIKRESDEHWIGFAMVGVPHLTVRVTDIDLVDVFTRGRTLRFEPSMAQGANVNFVGKSRGGEWAIRTYERGVETETLACGTGSISTAILLASAGEIQKSLSLRTRSGCIHTVRLQHADGLWIPSLSGEARLVFQGCLGDFSSSVT